MQNRIANPLIKTTLSEQWSSGNRFTGLDDLLIGVVSGLNWIVPVKPAFAGSSPLDTRVTCQTYDLLGLSMM